MALICTITRLFFLLSLIWCSILISLSSGFPSKGFVFPSKGEQEFGIFQQWMKDHGRIYPNSEESETRYQIFQKNLRHITEMNAKRSKSPSSYRLGPNKFADMSPEEFRQIYLHELKMPTTIAPITAPNTTANTTANYYAQQKDSCGAPASMDWRKRGVVTRVKNQESCGSCWAFAASAAIESVHAMATRELITLSEQELIDCDTRSEGCSGGWPSYAFEWVINNGGISKEDDYPYDAQQGYCRTNMNGNSAVQINSYQQVTPSSDDALLCAIAKQPIAVALDATNIQLYNGGIYEGEDCPMESTRLNHAVLIVGYDSRDGKDYWIAKNSWGEEWGMNGYIFIQRNTDLPNGVCSINTAASYPII